MKKKQLTKEALSVLFEDDFQLVNQVILQARTQIQSGNEDLHISDLLEGLKKNPPPFAQAKDLKKEEKQVDDEQTSTSET